MQNGAFWGNLEKKIAIYKLQNYGYEHTSFHNLLPIMLNFWHFRLQMSTDIFVFKCQKTFSSSNVKSYYTFDSDYKSSSSVTSDINRDFNGHSCIRTFEFNSAYWFRTPSLIVLVGFQRGGSSEPLETPPPRLRVCQRSRYGRYIIFNHIFQ